ncbi:MAG: ferredoxin-type protein NapG [Proteobacteria bacterium]|nr:ferredoxin-type protein NapG [Pseudomonadota bacterium]MCL2307570.1 ferredoxin-type protein NapG [Pseudomonadota bacterium]
MSAIDRRQFLIRTAQMAGVAACVAAVWSPLVRGQAHAAAHALRPPGALPEEDFMALCLKCGQCVKACPFKTLKLATVADHAPTGTPYFIARETPCEMCVDVPCVPVCPSGALDRSLTDITKARMGLPVIDREICLSFRGLRCEVCYRVCPVRGKAITLNIVHNEDTNRHARFEPVINSEHCTGCGICEKACPTEESSIRVLRHQFVQGKLGEHYSPSLGEDFKIQDIRQGTDIAKELNPGDKRQAAPGVGYFNQPGGREGIIPGAKP